MFIISTVTGLCSHVSASLFFLLLVVSTFYVSVLIMTKCGPTFEGAQTDVFRPTRTQSFILSSEQILDVHLLLQSATQDLSKITNFMSNGPFQGENDANLVALRALLSNKIYRNSYLNGVSILQSFLTYYSCGGEGFPGQGKSRRASACIKFRNSSILFKIPFPNIPKP